MKKKWNSRPWYEWVGWGFWLLVTIIFLQTALASRIELESKAASLSWIIFFVLLAFAGVVWGMRIVRDNTEVEESVKKTD
jgi:hypothetical protein